MAKKSKPAPAVAPKPEPVDAPIIEPAEPVVPAPPEVAEVILPTAIPAGTVGVAVPAPEIVARYELGPDRLASAAFAVLGDDGGHRMALRHFAFCVVVDAEGRVGLGVARNANINASDARKTAYAAAVADITQTS